MKIILDRPDDYSPRLFFKSWFGLYKKRVVVLEKHRTAIGKKFHRENRFNRYSGYLRSHMLKQRDPYREVSSRRVPVGKSFFNFWVARQPIS